MSLASFFTRYAAYNHWANRLMVDWVRNAERPLLDAHTPSSFPTLHTTLLHIWDAQFIWAERLHGATPHIFPSHEHQSLHEETFEGVLRSSEKLVHFVQDQEDAFFDGLMTYSTTSGKIITNQVSDILLQVLQHSTYHRGQLVTMGRSLGLENPPQTDFIAFTRLTP
ncbi:MAG: hypothetical protein IT270_10895 [Saprospiraceae bacterium]|nr:hypothetical protein [Saprospiraceae bacterium]